MKPGPVKNVRPGRVAVAVIAAVAVVIAAEIVDRAAASAVNIAVD